MPWLTKSRFLAGRQCLKRLWFEVHAPAEHSGESLALINGRDFDRLVQQLEPGVVVSRSQGMLPAFAQTQRLISTRTTPVIHQGAFRSRRLAVVTDLLRRTRRGFHLTEVKVTTEVKEIHLLDLGFQVLVLDRAGIPVTRASIGHINKEFTLERMNDYGGLLQEKNLTKDVRNLEPEIARSANECLAVLSKPEAPEVSMGNQCEDPHPCPFMDRCRGSLETVITFPLSILPHGGKAEEKLRAEGYTDLREVPVDRLKSDTHRRIHAATLNNTPHYDPAAAQSIRNLAAPYAYLDFETLNFAVPHVVGTRPYEQWPFQWSLHVENSPGALHHHDFLADKLEDFQTLTERLLAAIPNSGPIFVYNNSLERGVLERLAKHLPSLAPHLEDVIKRLVDLLPVTRAAYYHPAMLGSWSLKAVLPTLDASLAYDTLEEVSDGGAAQLAFLELADENNSGGRRQQIRTRLLDYCERDTYGMVVLRRFLCGDSRSIGKPDQQLMSEES